MTISNMQKTVIPTLLLAAAVVLAGCQGGEDQTLEERAQARWDRLVAGEPRSAWEYYTPGFRELTPAAEFADTIHSRPVRWTEAEVRGSECEEERCRVDVRVSYRTISGPTGIRGMHMTRDLEEQWIRIDGQWWYSQN